MRDILKQEIIGKKIVINDAQNKDLIGLKGVVVDETKNTLVIETNKGEKNLVKSQITITVTFNNETVNIEGAELVGRSEDRLKK